ncbi:MAG: hypothetical protein ACP5H5_10265, partial [Pyrobaculum sp.]
LDEITKGVLKSERRTNYWNFVPEWYIIECEEGTCVAKLGREGAVVFTITYSEWDCRVLDVHI